MGCVVVFLRRSCGCGGPLVLGNLSSCFVHVTPSLCDVGIVEAEGDRARPRFGTRRPGLIHHKSNRFNVQPRCLGFRNPINEPILGRKFVDNDLLENFRAEKFVEWDLFTNYTRFMARSLLSCRVLGWENQNGIAKTHVACHFRSGTKRSVTCGVDVPTLSYREIGE